MTEFREELYTEKGGSSPRAYRPVAHVYNISRNKAERGRAVLE